MNTQTISEEYRAEQQKLHQNPRYGVASLAFAPVVKSLLRLGRCTSIADYGAGKCNLKRALRLRAGGPIQYHPYDPAFPEYGPVRVADLVTCIDVLEHIELSALDAVLGELSETTRRLAFLTVHTGPAKKVLSDGRNAHLIQESPGWWLQRFEPYFDILHVQQVRKGFFVIACPKSMYRELGLDLDLPAISKAAGRRGGRARKGFLSVLTALTARRRLAQA